MAPSCAKHPARKAKRRCQACGHPFCAQCESPAGDRRHCSQACTLNARKIERRAARQKALGRTVSPRLGYASIALLLSAGLVTVLSVVDRLSRLDPMRALARHARTAPPAAPQLLSTAAPVGVAAPSSPSRPAARPPRPVALSQRTDSPPQIVVSFDAGSSDRGAAEILDALKSRGVRTTIFLTGEFIQRYPDVARRIARDGHEVGNHTFDHPHLTLLAERGGQRTRPGVTEFFVHDELRKTAALFQEVTGAAMAPIWRAPYGEENAEIRAWAERAGYRHISWTHGRGENLDSLDWVSNESARNYRSSESVVRRLLARARPGGIILMHLGSDRLEDPVAPRVAELLDSLALRGYRFARATEFLSRRSDSE